MRTRILEGNKGFRILMSASRIVVPAMVAVALIAACATTPKQAAVPGKKMEVDVAMAKDIVKYQTISNPKDETTVFNTDDQQVVTWVKLENIQGKHKMKWEWYDPKGKLYLTTDEYVINKNGDYHDAITA